MHPQDKCLLFCLPAELRPQIYDLCLITNTPILNAGRAGSNRPKHDCLEKDIPALGVTLSRTCRRIHAEFDVSPLYRENKYSFSNMNVTYSFFTHCLPKKNQGKACAITSITLDLREVIDAEGPRTTPSGVNSWNEYLCCNHGASDGRSWCHGGGPHLIDHVPPLRAVVLDLCDAQRKAASPCDEHNRLLWTDRDREMGARAMGAWWKDCEEGIPATARGLEVKVRFLDPKGEVIEVQIPGQWSRDWDCEEEKRDMLGRWFGDVFCVEMTAKGVFMAGMHSVSWGDGV